MIAFLLIMRVPLCHRRTVPRVQRSLRGEAVSGGHAVCRLRSQQETVPLPVSTGEARRVLRCRAGQDDEGLNSHSVCMQCFPSAWTPASLPPQILEIYYSCSLCSGNMQCLWAPYIMGGHGMCFNHVTWMLRG